MTQMQNRQHNSLKILRAGIRKIQSFCAFKAATWYFEKATLRVGTRNGHISSVEYVAADGVADGVEIPWERTDFAKDSQGN